MYDLIKSLIEQYDRIIIHRHYNPDGDAYGSQLGLKRLIELNYPDKEVYAVGGMNVYRFLGEMDTISDDKYQGSLAIILDVCVTHLIDDNRYTLADKVLVIDHHLNQPNFECISIIESDRIATCELVATFAMEQKYKFDETAATSLLAGLITDSGRFLFRNTNADTFDIAAFLVRQGGRLNWIYDQHYTETLNIKRLRGYFINEFKVTDQNVAYMMNTKDVKDRFNVSTFTVSRAMVNQMSGLENINIWVNFTEDDNGDIFVELRSAKESVVHIARKYGGGGHALACGCTLHSFEEANQFLEELNEFSKGCSS